MITGELEVRQAVNIQGPGADELAINANHASRAIRVHNLPVGVGNPTDVTISGLTVRNGKAAFGGGISSERDGGIEHRLNLNDMSILSNEANNGGGGGVFSDGAKLVIRDSLLTGNDATTAASNGGAVLIDDTPSDSYDAVTVDGTTLSGNTSAGDGGAIAAKGADAGISISASTLADNQAAGDGGGVSFDLDAGGAAVRSSTLSGNTASGGGGGVWIQGAPATSYISDSTVANNDASYGGGIGSLQDADGLVQVANSTVVGNGASGTKGGGGIFRLGDDGASAGTDLFEINSTVVAKNTVSASGAGPDLRQPATADGSFALRNTLLGNTAGAVFSQPGANLLNTDPALGGLADNGGPTQTMLPSDTSPVLNAGLRNTLNSDQRNLDRTVDYPNIPKTLGSDGTDIGAVELQLSDNGVIDSFFKADKKQKMKGKKVKVKVSAGAGEQVSIAAGGTVEVKAKKKKGHKAPKPETVNLKKATGESTPGTLDTLFLSPSKKGSKTIIKALKGGGKATATVKVTLTDEVSNTDTESLTVKLKVKKPKKDGGKGGK